MLGACLSPLRAVRLKYDTRLFKISQGTKVAFLGILA